MVDDIKKRPIYRDPSSAGPDHLPPSNSIQKPGIQPSQHYHELKSKGDAFKESWMQQLVAAKIKWSRLNETELMQIEGNQHKLIDLIQVRYSISRTDAEEQVAKFFSKNETSFTIAT